ncbi:MAG: hypothetical protein AAF703_16350 [Cyanobacteria bacterium P01_D01_bin.105]
MKRFTFSALSISVLLATGAIAPSAQALPQVNADFKLQTLRLSELDTRNKSEYDQSEWDAPTFKLQTLRLSELDTRNKSDYAPSDYEFKLQTLRLSELDTRNKSDYAPSDYEFKLQTLRLSELDARNKSEYDQEAYNYYPQTPAQAAPENVTAEQDSVQTAEPTVSETPAPQEETASAETPSTELSILERRRQALDQRS